MESRIETAPASNELREESTNKVVSDIRTLVQRAKEQAVERAKAADQVVRGHPYQTIGVAFGLGVLIGILARRR